nr:hypothetical protein [Methanobrevibacter arboriphilus]
MVIKQLKYENRVNSYRLLEKILNSIKELYDYNNKKDTKSNEIFRLWIIKQMVENKHVIFYELQIRLAYIQYLTNIKIDYENEKIMNMSQKNIESWMNEIYEKNRNDYENMNQCKKEEFRGTLLKYLDDKISSKCVE